MPPGGPNDDGKKPDHTGAGIGAIQKMTTQTGGPAPENQRIAALVVGVAGVIGLIIGVAMIVAGQAGWGAALVIVVCVLMAIALFVALAAAKHSAPQQAGAPTAARVTHRWFRRLPKQPIDPESRLMQFKKPLEDLRG